MRRAHRKGQRIEQENKTRHHVPHRKCLVERTVKPTNKMLRFVLDPDMVVVPDLKASLPGRGVWITAKRSAIDFAVKKGLFRRGFKKNAIADEKLGERLEKLLETAALQSLSLAQKSGLACVGQEKVLACIAKTQLRAVLFAADGSTGSIAKVRARLHYHAHADHVIVHNSFRSELLDVVFGRVNVVHVALKNGGMTEACLSNIQRLEEFRSMAENGNEDGAVMYTQSPE